MNLSPGELSHLRAYLSASAELNGWIRGARAFALLHGAFESGVLSALSDPSTPEQAAATTGIDPLFVGDLCLALEEYGVVVREDDSYRLAPAYVRLSSPGAAVPLPAVIRQTAVMLRTLEAVASADGTYVGLPADDVLAMAEGAGISALSSSPHVSIEIIARLMPEVGARWTGGARHLEAGCGVGNALFGVLLSYPAVTAVGIEIHDRIAQEAKRRAAMLGVEGRVELRRMDACKLQDQDEYDTVQWSQFFFPAEIREAALGAMHRALKPGGYLFMPWLGSVSEDTAPRRGEMLRMALRTLSSSRVASMIFLNDFLGDSAKRRRKERRFSGLQRLLFSLWGVPVRPVGELEAEVAGAGFRVVRAMRSPDSQFALTRGFLLAQCEK